MASQVQVTPTRISVPASATEQRLVTSFGDTVYYGTSSVTSSSYTGTLTDGQSLKINDVTWFVTAADIGRKVPGGARLSVIEHDVDATGPTTVVAHVPTDADFEYTPPNGAQALNSSTGIEYVRIGGIWTAVSGTTYPDGVTAAIVVPRAGVVYDIRDYGARVDGVTLADGAMSGTAVLTSASAGFTSADVGKRIVVNNALGAGVHLYTTISAYTSATTVTLASAASATITSAIFSYGTDDLAAWTAAIAAAPAGATILCTGRSVIFGTITPTKAVAFKGAGVTPVFGPFSGGAGSVVLPIAAPFLRGSVIVQAKASTDAISTAIQGEALNLEDIGIYFAGMFKTTGNGILSSPPAVSGHGYEQGLAGFYWRNVQIYGHDATHRAVDLRNPYYGTIEHIWSYGGGGYRFEQNTDLNPYGNLTMLHAYHAGVDGSLKGFDLTTTLGQLLNLITMVRPQAISASSYFASVFSAFGTLTWSGVGFDGSGAVNVVLLGPNIENSNMRVGKDFYTLGPQNFAGTTEYSNGSALQDSLPFGSLYDTTRRINRDGSVSLNGSAESTGGTLSLLKDNPAAADWAITTDGTVRMLLPGSLRATGSSVSASVGAGLGTSPPPALVKGSDLAGRLLFGSGTSTAAGALTAVSFARTQVAAPTIVLTALNSATQALGLYVSAVSTTGFTISAANAPTASQAITTYAVSYVAVDSGGAPVVPVVFETFDKTDSASSLGSPGIGPAPVANSGTWGISSNRGYLATPVGNDTVTWDSGLADCTVSAKIVTAGASSGICVRNDGTSFIYMVQGTLWRKSGGSFTGLGNLSPNFASGDTISMVLLGSSIKCYVNGVLSLSVTETMNQAVTKHGLFSTISTARFDNFQVTA